jgi:hydroxymethylpyrimidine pyrophosphatase-like HAD family hydrolase
MSKKLITDELIEQKMISYGFGEIESHDEEHIRKVVLDHYDAELTDQWRENCEYYIYEESTADGYTVYISTSDTRNICVNENIHYYESSLSEELQDAIKDSGEIYVDDLFQDFIDDAIQELYLYLAERFQEQALDELQDEGYELVTIKDERYEQN